MSGLAIEHALRRWIAAGLLRMGDLAIGELPGDTFALSHREDADRADLELHIGAERAGDLARFDDAGAYRPLKTAPNLRHGWKLHVHGLPELRTALDCFYPGRLPVFLAFERRELMTTPLRNTLDRQSGMYRIAAQITEPQADELIGRFCRSDGGCLRTILWRRDSVGTTPSTRLPAVKFEPVNDQTGRAKAVIPLLCQEACNLVVAEARKVVQSS